MKKLLFTLFTIILISSTFSLPKETFATGSYHSGDLEITWETFPGGPIFSLDDFKPGDCVEKTVKVKNKKNVSTKVIITSKNVENSILSDVSMIEISEGATIIYGPKSLNEFFTDSASPHGLILATIPPNSVKMYKFKVCFDIDAGNEYQKLKVVFDLVFGKDLVIPTIKINEVYYDVDSSHGLDSPKDRGVSIHGSFYEAELFGKCFCIDNTPRYRTYFRDFDRGRGDCGKKRGQNDEWIELYNPGDSDVSLKGWVLTDGSGGRIINANKIIKAHGFALVSKDASTWSFWNEDPDAIKVELGGQIGDGLGDDGDHITLISPFGVRTDKVGWEGDHVVWNPSVPDVPLGSSIERSSAGFDNDVTSDWLTKTPPTPGN